MQFPDLINREPCFKGKDVIFYGYRSIKDRAKAALYAEDIRMSLTEFCKCPRKFMAWETAAFRTTQSIYKSIMFIGHSLGALLCRQVLLEATHAGDSWAKTAKLVLFAPAHKGASSSVLLRLVGQLMPVIADIRVGSDFLSDLERRTCFAVNAGSANHLIARKIIFGYNDTWVNPNRFDHDPAIVMIKGRNHVNVCKPTEEYARPLHEVAECL